MLQGNITKALKYVDSDSVISGVHTVDKNVLKTLKLKHPTAQPLIEECLVEESANTVQPVIFEEIDSELIYQLAKKATGSGGPSKVDSEHWKHILCNKSYGNVSVQLCQSIADVTKRLCQEEVSTACVHHLLSCRLIPLKKDTSGVRPIGIGEMLRRLMAKAVVKVLQNDIQQAAGPLQTCAGLDGGIEATIHAMSKAYHDTTSEALLLVDADNAFNSLNRANALKNIQSLCPPFYNFLNNTYKSPSKMYVSNSEEVILSQEGTTQGDPDAMHMYAISTRPIIDQLHEVCDTSVTKQC